MRVVDVAVELEVLADALRILLDELAVGGISHLRARERVPQCSAAVLAVIVARLELLQRVASGSMDPALARTDVNETTADPGDARLLLRPWVPKQVIAHAEEEISMARRRARKGGRRG